MEKTTDAQHDELSKQDDTEDLSETVRDCMRALRDGHVRFILVGGAAGLLVGSGRATSDIDLLLPSESTLEAMHQLLLGIPGFSAPQGVLTYRGRVSMTVDLLKNVVLEKTYADFAGQLREWDGVSLLQFDAALCVKLHCFYYRQDDENGLRKQKTDLHDVAWLSRQMHSRGMTISDHVASMFQIGRYHLLLVRLELRPEDLARLIEVGGQKLVRPWEEETPEQKEYFEWFAPAGACPLTGPLTEDSHDVMTSE